MTRTRKTRLLLAALGVGVGVAAFVVGPSGRPAHRAPWPFERERTIVNAVKQGEVETIKTLLASGFDARMTTGVDADGDMIFGSLPLLITAARAGHPEVIDLLVRHGADPNCKWLDGSSPLMHAAYKGNLAAVKLLIDHRARLDEQDEYGYSALMLAVSGRRPDVVAHLLRTGANGRLTDRAGRTARDLAKERGYTEITRFLTAPRTAAAVAAKPPRPAPKTQP